MSYDPEKARRRYREKRDEYRRAKEFVERAGLAAVIDQHVQELFHSRNLKVFRWTPRMGKAHMYAELSDGTKHPLCGQSVDESVPASSIVRTKPGDCHWCNRFAEEILKRRADGLGE